MEVTVQWVTTTWSKRSRGAPHSDARSRVPEAFALPAGFSPLLHEVMVQEQDGFRPQSTITEGLPARERLRLREQGDELTIQLPDGFGVPVRSYRPEITIRRGTWVRWQMNNRWSSASGMNDWFYDLQTVNIAFGPVSREAFLGVPPHRVDELAVLR